MIIKTKLDESTICDQDNCLLRDYPNLKCHLTPVNSNILCNNSNLPLILTNNNCCIPCNITVGTSETIGNLNYNINEITFAASDTPFQMLIQLKPILNDHKPSHETNAGLHPQSNLVNKINFHHSKTLNVTTNVTTAHHNSTSMKPFKPSNKIKTGDSKQLPSPIKDPKIVTSPAEVNYHRKVTLKNASIMMDYDDIFF